MQSESQPVFFTEAKPKRTFSAINKPVSGAMLKNVALAQIGQALKITEASTAEEKTDENKQKVAAPFETIDLKENTKDMPKYYQTYRALLILGTIILLSIGGIIGTVVWIVIVNSAKNPKHTSHKPVVTVADAVNGNTLLQTTPTTPTKPAIVATAKHDHSKRFGVYKFKIPLADKTVMDLSTLQGHVMLFVNVASKDKTLTEQNYEELELLHQEFSKKRFVIVAVPSNDFGMELSSGESVLRFAKHRFGSSFIISDMMHVVDGKQQSSLYKYFTKQTGHQISGNYEKVLVDAKGKVVHISSAYPLELRDKIQKLVNK